MVVDGLASCAGCLVDSSLFTVCFFGDSIFVVEFCAYEMTALPRRIKQTNNFLDRPNMIGNPRLHGWRDAESLMDSRKIVKHEIERECVDMILNLFGMRIGQTGKSSHAHADI